MDLKRVRLLGEDIYPEPWMNPLVSNHVEVTTMFGFGQPLSRMVLTTMKCS